MFQQVVFYKLLLLFRSSDTAVPRPITNVAVPQQRVAQAPKPAVTQEVRKPALVQEVTKPAEVEKSNVDDLLGLSKL